MSATHKPFDWVCQDVPQGKQFVVFGDDGLSNEPVTTADIAEVTFTTPMNGCASAAWSAGCAWYFAVVDDGILLGRVGAAEGLKCMKRSAQFITAFIELPGGCAKRRRARESRP